MDEFLKSRQVARIAKQQLWGAFRKDPNIAGAGFGRRVVGRGAPECPALVVYVHKKLSMSLIPPSVRLPRKIYIGNDFIEVDVVETGPFYTQSFTGRERPAPSGISIGHTNITAGTLGCLVNDNTDGTLCILSNNHILADANGASIGDPSIQPGDADGGSSPADDIATLKRFITVDCAGTNRVDAAIAEVINKADVVDMFKDNLMPYPGPDHPAIGLLFAGGGGRTLLNPIRDVMSLLDISFLAGAGAIGAADIGMAVEKVGRTTEYTTGQVMEIDVTSMVGTYQCGDAQFDGQIATCTMSAGGDSGSVVCAGGEGICSEPDGGCGTSATASRVFGLDISIDRIVEKEFRERYLSRTLVGRYLIDVFFRNEAQLNHRVQDGMKGKGAEANRDLVRGLHEKYGGALREALLQPDRSDLRLSGEHLEQADMVLGRARPFMSPEEVRAAEEVLGIAKAALGKTVREILDMLDNRDLHARAVELVASVPSLKEPDCDRGST